jgi:acetylornithine deacetylase/succinyl-diaminopimelate desuccinylase-like protein
MSRSTRAFLATTGLALGLIAAHPATAQVVTTQGVPAFDAGHLRPDQVAFRDTFRELVETDTTLSNGSCTLAAERMAARLRAAGFTDDQLTVFSTPEHPKNGGLVAVLPGDGSGGGPILLLAHLDVVEARRADWTRDPFTLVEEGGYFYARGVADTKALAAAWVDILARLRAEGATPRRTLKMALTCGEESGEFNGAQWLVANRPDLIQADFVLNEGGGGETDGQGRLIAQSLQVGEKTYQDYRLETVNAGGHSSIPIRDNAIYQLAAALLKVRDHAFPVEITDTTRTYLARSGALIGGEQGAAMQALAADPTDAAAAARVSEDRGLNSVLRTTCVGTMIEGGHANNALPQRADAVVNCRIFPGHDVEEIRAALVAVVDDSGVAITLIDPKARNAAPPPLDPAVVGPIEGVTQRYFPGIPVIPSMSTGATDAVHFAPAGIPVYGVTGMWFDPDGNGQHGLNERVEVASVYVGRDYLTDLIRALAY